MPKPAPAVLAPRRKTRQFKVGTVGIGSESPISVQSMTTTKTHDIGSTLQQIAELTAAGCDIVRVACPTDKDAEALPIIAKQSNIPVIADIHFQPKYVYAAIKAGCGAVRVNPGNIRKFDDQVKEIAEMASDHGTSIRIGVNAGSFDHKMLKKHGGGQGLHGRQDALEERRQAPLEGGVLEGGGDALEPSLDDLAD